jgi:hypothetical protein
VRTKAAYKTLTPSSHPDSSSAAVNSNSKATPVNTVAAGG